MSKYEKQMLGGILAVIIAYGGFFLSMTDGWVVGDRSMLFLAISVGAFLAITVTIMSFVAKANPENTVDEREVEIEQWSESVGYYALESGVFVLIVLTLLDGRYAFLQSYRFTRPEGLILALVTISALAGLGRMMSAFFEARRV